MKFFLTTLSKKVRLFLCTKQPDFFEILSITIILKTLSNAHHDIISAAKRLVVQPSQQSLLGKVRQH